MPVFRSLSFWQYCLYIKSTIFKAVLATLIYFVHCIHGIAALTYFVRYIHGYMKSGPTIYARATSCDLSCGSENLKAGFPLVDVFCTKRLFSWQKFLSPFSELDLIQSVIFCISCFFLHNVK